jgi:hypothetical protein
MTFTKDFKALRNWVYGNEIAYRQTVVRVEKYVEYGKQTVSQLRELLLFLESKYGTSALRRIKIKPITLIKKVAVKMVNHPNFNTLDLIYYAEHSSKKNVRMIAQDRYLEVEGRLPYFLWILANELNQRGGSFVKAVHISLLHAPRSSAADFYRLCREGYTSGIRKAALRKLAVSEYLSLEMVAYLESEFPKSDA